MITLGFIFLFLFSYFPALIGSQTASANSAQEVRLKISQEIEAKEFDEKQKREIDEDTDLTNVIIPDECLGYVTSIKSLRKLVEKHIDPGHQLLGTEYLIAWTDFQYEVEQFEALCNVRRQGKGFFVEQTYVGKDTRILAVGDLHGGIYDLLRIFDYWIDRGFLKDDYSVTPGVHLVFLGDYVDRGQGGVEVLFALLKLKIKNWSQVTLIRGNHENLDVNRDYGFLDELRKKYHKTEILSTFSGMLSRVYERLPSAVFMAGGQIVEREQPTYALFLHGMLEEGLLASSAAFASLTPRKESTGELKVTEKVCWIDIEQSLPELQRVLRAEVRPCTDQRWLETEASAYYSRLQMIVRGHQHAVECGVLFDSQVWDDLQKKQQTDESLAPYFTELYAGKYCSSGPFPVRAAKKLIEKVYGVSKPFNTYLSKVVTLSATLNVPHTGDIKALGYLVLNPGPTAAATWTITWHSISNGDDLLLHGASVTNSSQQSASTTTTTPATQSAASSASSSSVTSSTASAVSS